MGRQLPAREAFVASGRFSDKTDVVRRARLQLRVGRTFELQNGYDDALQEYQSAEDILTAAPTTERQQAWHAGWIEVHGHRLWNFYWTGKTQAMVDSLQLLHEPLHRHGSSAQKAQYFQLCALQRMRSERFLISEETLEFARLARSMVSSANPSELPMLQLTFAFSLLFHGCTDEALPAMQEALEAAERAGDVAVQCRALTYLMIIWRRRGDIKSATAIADRTRALASSSQMHHYIGAAEATLGWAALREGRATVARTRCEAALASWQRARPGIFPFQWMAVLPLATALLELGASASALQHLQIVLQDSQQQLPDELSSSIKLLGEHTRSELADVRYEFAVCLATAARHGLV